MKQLFLYLGVLLTFASCNKNDNLPKTVNNDAEITLKVNELYSIYGKSTESLYKVPFADSIFSPGLKKNLDEAVKASNASIERTEKEKKGDKPQIFEGSLFTSLYEGYTNYKIVSVKMLNDSGEAKAEVNVEFENSNENPKITWVDKINLINPGDGWKIDNIDFDDKLGNTSDLKKSLASFIEGAKTN
ncbi:hypothetical protein [Chryseobacterium daeguense]|uniref:hypothetical protein n=1 Tax=Chryseobacterium daeguense TaxID=412438 RepID=UPI0003F62375|nr:hypothetical protein [Chryseobacterium daeguense]